MSRRDVTLLRRRLEIQERSLAELQRRLDSGNVPGVESAPHSTPLPAAGEPRRATAAPAPPRRSTGGPSGSGDIESILGGQWMTWIGILAIFFGTAFFLAYDMGSHPIAGTGQVLAGLLMGVTFILAGRTLAPRVGRFLARGLLGGGIALLYLSAYAANAFHHLVPAAVVFPFLLGVAVIGTTIALRENSLMVATLTQTGALLTPFFLSPERGEDPTVFFFFLASVTLGSVLVARKRDWLLLPLTGFLGTAMLVVWWWFKVYTLDLRPAVAFGVSLVWLLHAVSPFLSAPGSRVFGMARALVIAANGFLYLVALFVLLAPEYGALRGVATALLAVIYVLGARLAPHGLAPDGAVRLTRLTGLSIAALAIPIQFDLQWVTLGWSLLALVLLHGGMTESGRGERWLAYGVLGLAVLHALFWDTVAAFGSLEDYRPWINGNFLAGAGSAATLGLAAWLLARHRAMLPPPERRLVTPLILTAASVFLIRIMVEVVAGYEIREQLTHENLYLAMLLTLTLIWTVYSGLLILAGFLFAYRPIRFLGIVLLAILLLKVFLFDLQELERGYRIASFVGVGLLLLLISILYQRERRAA